jgi:hypothetical protein
MKIAIIFKTKLINSFLAPIPSKELPPNPWKTTKDEEVWLGRPTVDVGTAGLGEVGVRVVGALEALGHDIPAREIEPNVTPSSIIGQWLPLSEGAGSNFVTTGVRGLVLGDTVPLEACLVFSGFGAGIVFRGKDGVSVGGFDFEVLLVVAFNGDPVGSNGAPGGIDDKSSQIPPGQHTFSPRRVPQVDPC